MKKTLSSYSSLLILLPSLFLVNEKKEFTLPEIIDLGLQNNPLIAAKLKGYEAKKAGYEAAKHLVNPELELNTGKAKSYDSLTKRTTEGFLISQYIENPLKRHYRIQVYEKDWQAAEYLYNFSKIEVTFELKNLFYRIFFLKERKELAEKNLDSIKEIHQLIEKRAKLGEVKELEAIKLNVEILKAQNELNKFQTELNLAKENLNMFLAYSLPSDFTIAGQLGFSALEVDEKYLLKKTLLSYPLIKEKEKELELAKANLSYTRWQRFPDFKLSGFIQNELDGKDMGIGISLDIPLWNFRSKEIAEAENLLLKESEELKALQIEISTSVKSKLSQIKLSEQTIKLFQEGLLKQAEESLKISEISYKQGEISLMDYLDSQRTYYGVLKDYQDSLQTWNIDKAALEKAVGEELK